MSNQDEHRDALEALLREHGGDMDEVGPLDDEDIRLRTGPDDGDGMGDAPPRRAAGGRRRRRQHCEPMLLRAADAEAAMFGEPEPPRIEDLFDTSCDEEEEEEEDPLMGDDEESAFGEVFGDGPGLPQRPGPSEPRARGARRSSLKVCFGCKYSSRPDLGDTDALIPGDAINQLVSIWDTQIGRVGLPQLAKMCHEFYKTEILLAARKRGRFDLPVWRTREIYDHFVHHNMDPRVWILTEIAEWQGYSRTLSEALFMKNMGTISPVEKFFRLRHMASKRVEELRKLKPVDMTFYDPECAISFNALGKAVNPVRDFFLEER